MANLVVYSMLYFIFQELVYLKVQVNHPTVLSILFGLLTRRNHASGLVSYVSILTVLVEECCNKHRQASVSLNMNSYNLVMIP